MSAFRRFFQLGLLSGLTLMSQQSLATPTAADFQSEPPIVAESSDPLVLLGLSVDHELFKKAYSDYSNLDGGELTTADTTYRNDFTYYGYFDSSYCYTYDTVDNRFEPHSSAGSPYSCAATGTAGVAGGWSGNFLNWATMTRMDIVRRVLYGGKRSTDSTSETVLERAHLPDDAHAFVKVYAGSDIGNYTPYATALSLCNVSSGSDPQIRLAFGQWRQWSATEALQCQWGSASTTPTTADNPLTGTNALKARVQVCVAGKDESSDSCRAYGSSSLKKPAGLLQENGEDGDTRFGLITGSYANNDSGGILRKNISLIANSNGDGSDNTSADEIKLSTGEFTGIDGIIKTLDGLKIQRWRWWDPVDKAYKYEDCTSPSISVSTFISTASDSTAATTHCGDWGNPVGEIYLEGLRYFAGETSATSAFYADESGRGWTSLSTWTDPMSSAEPCAKCAFIMLSSGMNSFDGDDLGTASDLPGLSGASDIDDFTNDIGDAEAGGTFSGTYLSGGSDEVCAPRSLSDLTDASGICPERPALQGTYDIAGLAYYSRITDIRTQTGFEGDQIVDNFMVELAESLPSFSAIVDGSRVTFLPACQSNEDAGATDSDDSGWQGCSLMDVQVESLAADGSSGSYLIYWEDSHWGNDYDLDVIQRLKFCVGNACSPSINSNQIKITSSTPYAFAGNALRLSYTISGTASSDGIVDSWALRPGWNNCLPNLNPVTRADQSCNFDALNGTDSIPTGVTSKTTTFTAGSSAASLLSRPLYLAAKYGGFNDLDGDNLPSSSSEWDVKDTQGNYALDGSGNIVGDGIPDNYYQLSNPALLEDALGSILNSLKSSITSSSAAAVVANTSSGEGAIFQGSYYPQFEASSTDSIKWPGMLHALFRDANGYFREDTDGDDVLDDYTVDYAVNFFYDQTLDATRVSRFSSSDNGETFTQVDTISFSDFNAIWNARDQLSALSNSEAVTQRSSFSSLASSGRYIITGIDTDGDGTVQSDEVLNFNAGSGDDLDPATTDYYRYFGLDTASKASVENIVNFIRGEEGISGYRSRAVDYDGDGVEEVWRLGDLVHSAPTSVSFPRARFDARYGDDTYTTYRQLYQKRRQVIYVGGNDGMLHAFNAGFYDATTKTFATQTSALETAHPLGSELWAYVPMAVLPHLQWQTAPDYGHVYYVDGSPRIYDVNIFANDTDHPGGWGTILVMGLRFGGGDFDLDVDGDGNYGEANNDVTTRSSFLVFDVTNPEVAPRLLAEIQRPAEQLMTLSVDNAGDGYATAPAVTISGDGLGATAVATLSDNGSIITSSLVINDGGSGYSVGDSISVSGDGSGAVLVVDAVDASGAITAASVSNPGSGYSTLEVTASHGHSDAVLVPNLGNGGNSDKLKTIDITDGGSGYSVGDTVTFSGDGTGASATVSSVDTNGSITDFDSVDIVEGSGYTTISVDSISRSMSGVADIDVTLGFPVASIDITSQGSGYNSGTTTVTVDSGSGTTATASVSFATQTWGYTTSRPVVVKRRTPDASGSYATPSENDWYLVFASGPSGSDALSDATSDDAGKLFFYDLNDMAFVSATEFDSSSYGGNLAAQDWDNDFQDDAIYFGTVAEASGIQTGNLKRVELDFDAISGSSLLTLLDTDNPIVETPRLAEDGFGNRWVYVGTGRFLVPADSSTTKTQYYYGLIESDPAAGVSALSDMVDVTDIQVFSANPESYTTANTVRDCPSPCIDPSSSGDVDVNGVTVTDWQQLRTEILKTSGWYRELNLSDLVSNTSAARMVGASNLVGSTLLFSEYAPSTEQCEPVGYSRINAYHYQTGTASPYAPVGVDSTYTHNGGDLVKTDTGISNSLSLLGGDGEGDADDAQGTGISVDDHGVLTDHGPDAEPARFGRQSWQEINVNWDIGL